MTHSCPACNTAVRAASRALCHDLLACLAAPTPQPALSARLRVR